MKRILVCLLAMAFATGVTVISIAQDDSLQVSEDKKADDSEAKSETEIATERIFAFYLHGDRRCATCRKLEAYSEEALKEGFPEMLKDSTLVWGTINYDRKENEHYLKDYNLFTKALVLSRVKNGTEVEWKKLDRIWNLVNNKERFLIYVQKETEAFLNQDKK